MPGQHGLLLAVSLIKGHFGQLVSNVCECLLRRGSLSVQDIAQQTGFEMKRVKNCLMVLVQHNCVQPFSIEKPGPGGSSKLVTPYMAIFDNIIHRMRFAKFQAIVADALGRNCEILIEGLIKQGRLSFGQLRQHAQSKEDIDITRDELLDSFNKLVSAHYVERCPKTDPFIAPISDDGSKNRGDKSLLQTLTLEKQALAAAILSDAERFCGPSGSPADLEENKAEKSSPRAGTKKKSGALDMDEQTQASINENDILWRPNFEKFLHCLGRNLCAVKKSESLGPQAGCVLKALIDSSGGQVLGHTVASTLDSIFETLGGVSQGCPPPPSIKETVPILEALGCQSTTEDGTTYYSIDLKAIIKECQIDEVEDLILKRYGKDAFRIFRLLSKTNRPFETDKISDSTFVDKKETLKLLHKLWKDDYLHMEKMATAATGPGQKSFFLWRVNRRSLWEQYLDDMHHAAFNLKRRVDDMEKEVSENTASSDEKQLEKLRFRISVLQGSLLKLDDRIMLFHDLMCHNDL